MLDFNINPCPYDIMYNYLDGNGYVKTGSTGANEVWVNGDSYVNIPLSRTPIPSFKVAEIIRQTNGTKLSLELYNPIVNR